MADSVIKFHRAPSVNRDKGLDMVMAYPRPTTDSPFNLTALSILFPGKMFEDQGLRVAYWDDRFDSQQMLEDLMRDTKQVAVSAFTGTQCAAAADILIRAKEINPKIITHCGGHHARLLPKQVEAEPFVDVIWPERSYHEHSFPFSPAAQRLWKLGDLQYLTSSGCSYGCRFCALRSAWTPRPIEQIEHELDAIISLTGHTEISLCDPNFGQMHYTDTDGVKHRGGRIERMKEMGRIFRKHNLKVDGNVRSDYVTKEYVDELVKAGFTSIEFGAESGDEEFLRQRIRKGHGTASIRDANKLMAGSGISIMNSFIRGCPYERQDQWLRTMDFIDELKDIAPECRVSVYRFVPYPGSPFYDDAVAGRGIEKFDPPQSMKAWGTMKLMADATYWCTGMVHRLDNTTANFPGKDWEIIAPYVDLARKLWKERRPEDFPAEDVERLIVWQVRKHNAQAA